MAQDAQKSLAGRPLSVLRSATVGGTSAAAGASVGSTIGGGSGQRPLAPCLSAVDAGSVLGTSAAADAPEV